MEINQELRLQLAKYKQDFRDLTEKFLISQATAYSLANQLQKYKCEACKDIVESVLGEKLLFEVRRPAEKPAEKPTLDEMLRMCDTLIRSQARELTQLRQTLQHGKDDSVLLKKHLKDLLTHNDQGSHQGQGFRERLSEGYRLAERIACKLSPEIYEDEDDEQAQEKLTPSMELQVVEEREVPEESKDECGLMPSILQGSSDSQQPYSNDKFKDLEADLGQDGACGCSHAKEEEIPTNVSDNENYHKPMSGQELPFPSVNLQDDEKKVVFQQSQDECVSVPSTLQEDSACNQPYSDGKFAFDEENVTSAMDGACGCSHAEEDEISTGLPENQNDHDDMKGPEVVTPRFSRQLPQMRGNGVPRDSLDEYYLTYSVLPGLSDSFWPYRSNAIFSLEDVDVSYARDVTKNLADLEDEEDQDIISSSVEQLVVEENEVHPDSLDERYLAASVGHHRAGSCHPYRSASFPTEGREVCLALDVNGDTWEDCHRGPVSFPGSEVPTSQAQLQKSTPETDCLQRQLDQHFDCGDCKAMLGLSSTIWDFTSNSDSGNQGPLFLELGASISMKNPPKLEECEACKDIVESVLGEKLLFEVRRPAEKPAEKPTLVEMLRMCDTLIRSQARELTQLRQTLQHGKDDSVLLKKHLKDLLTHNDQGSHQGQGFRERLSEGYRLAERIACKLSPDNENYHKPMSGQELPFPSVNLQDDEKKVVFQQSQDECVSVPSTLQEDSACNQPYSDGKFAFDEENVASAMDGACGCSHAEEDEIPTGLPENQNDHDDMKGPEVVAPRFSRQLPQLRGNGVPRDSLDEYYLTYSVLPGLSDSFWPYRSNAIFSLEDVDVSYARDVTKNLADLEDKEDQDIISSSVEQLVVEENKVQPDSLDECYLAASVGHHLAGSCHPYRSASFPTERREVCLALDVNGDTWEDCHRGLVSFPGSEVPASQAQLQKSTTVTDCLQRQLDQHFDCGDSKAMLGLSSTIWDITSNSDSGNQGPLFLVHISLKELPDPHIHFIWDYSSLPSTGASRYLALMPQAVASSEE
ncbi:hypothetical protein JEQ12_000741 [Ovis aries]|uniref:Olduvai domain-containing protein n=1 Tax=Ovis aries TaxID=9940 RepID=A0A836D882_SHEEP|nr:hypothetical protein JEQ12_000741 [Ovis aries]